MVQSRHDLYEYRPDIIRAEWAMYLSVPGAKGQHLLTEVNQWVKFNAWRKDQGLRPIKRGAFRDICYKDTA